MSEIEPESAVVGARVQPGVFFEVPESLPRGPHRLSREQVCSAQRERLLIAFTELLAEGGYASLRIGDLTKRAAVSNDAFYKLFASKEDCGCAAYERFVSGIVRIALEAGLARSRTWREYVQASVDGYLGALSADPVAARAFQLEMSCIGPKARERRRSAAAWFADERLKAQEQLRKTDPGLRARSLDAHLAAVLGMRELAGEALEAWGTPDFARLAPELVDWVVAAWY
jgi:AcrR family transcriptional regulator